MLVASSLGMTLVTMAPQDSEFEVEGEFDLAGGCAFDRLGEAGLGKIAGAEDGINFSHVGMIQEIE